MRHKRFITIGITTLMLVSLCAAAAATSVTAADSRDTRAPPVSGAGTVGAGAQQNFGCALCSQGPNHIDFFATGGDGNLWHRSWAGSWSTWENLGTPSGGLSSAPTAVSWGSNRIDVFVRGSDSNLWQLWYQNGWKSWVNLGKPGASLVGFSAPGASSWGANRLDVFALCSDGNLWQLYYENGWQRWYNLGNPGVGITHCSPGAVSTSSWGYKRIDVLVRGDDSTLYQRWYRTGSWYWSKFTETAGLVPEWAGQTPIGGPKSDYDYAPAVCSMHANRLDVFFVDYNGHLQQDYYDNGWKPLFAVGGSQNINGPGGAVTWQKGGTTRLDLFMPGDNLATYQKWWQGSWTEWKNLGMIG